MKKLAILFFLFIGAVAFAQIVKFEDSNFASVLAKRRRAQNFRIF